MLNDVTYTHIFTVHICTQFYFTFTFIQLYTICRLSFTRNSITNETFDIRFIWSRIPNDPMLYYGTNVCIMHEKKIMTHGYDYLFLVPGKVPNNVYVFGLFWVFSIFISHLKIYFLVKYIHAFFIIKRMILMSKLRVSFGRSSITKH